MGLPHEPASLVRIERLAGLFRVRGHQQQANDVLGKIAEEYAIGSPIPSIRAFYLAPSGRDSGGSIRPRFQWSH